MKMALSVAVVLIMIGAGGAVAETVETIPPPHPLAVSTTNPDSMTAAIFKALGCTVPEGAEPDRCARR
jgi:hypothetical protein